jgi:hypothetical protein
LGKGRLTERKAEGVGQSEGRNTWKSPLDNTTSSRISRMQTKHNMKTVALPVRNLSSFLRTIKDEPALKTPGAYSIPCECGTNRAFDLDEDKDHHPHTSASHRPEKSVAAEHSMNLNHPNYPTPVFWPRSGEAWTDSSGK